MKRLCILFIIFSAQAYAQSDENLLDVIPSVEDVELLNANGLDIQLPRCGTYPSETKSAAIDDIITKSIELNDKRAAQKAYAECLAKNFPDEINLNDKIQAGMYWWGAGGTRPKMAEYINALDARKKWGTPHYIKTLKDLNKHDSSTDVGLVMALAHRESSTSVISGSNELKNSYSSGGLDYIGSHHKELVDKYLPKGYGEGWVIATSKTGNEASKYDNNGNIINGGGYQADIPQKEMVMAYGAYVKKVETDMFAKMKAKGITQDQIDSLSPEARRFWTLLSFAGPGGGKFNKSMSAGSLGFETAFGFFQEKMNSGSAKSLNDLAQLKEMKGFHRIRIALATAANATYISDVFELDTQSASGQDCPLP
jgi:hypothetical protein